MDSNDSNSTSQAADTTPSGDGAVKNILSTIRSAVQGGQLTRQQARMFRSEIVITQAFFTRKQSTNTQRKSKRVQQRAARKLNRGHVKGERCGGGRT